jgi:hypothetical protein
MRMQEYYLETDRETDHETLQLAQIPLQCYLTHENSHTCQEICRGNVRSQQTCPTCRSSNSCCCKSRVWTQICESRSMNYFPNHTQAVVNVVTQSSWLENLSSALAWISSLLRHWTLKSWRSLMELSCLDSSLRPSDNAPPKYWRDLQCYQLFQNNNSTNNTWLDRTPHTHIHTDLILRNWV